MNITAEQLKQMPKEEVFAFIRKVLAYPEVVIKSAQKNVDLRGEHYRFDMTGEDGRTTGSNTIHNQTILNKFAFLGIYDYTKFLTIDFYKGHGTLYFCYFNDDIESVQEVELGGYKTTEIIYEVFKRTIFTDLPKRRR